jgi:hypothetical protein
LDRRVLPAREGAIAESLICAAEGSTTPVNLVTESLQANDIVRQ